MGHMNVTTPLSGTVCPPYAGTWYDQFSHQIWSLYVHPLWRYERQRKCRNWDGLRVRGHPRSLAMSPLDRVHMTSYSTLIESMHLSCTVFELQQVICQKSPILTYATWIQCQSHSNFAEIFGIKKLDSLIYLSHDTDSAILHLAILTQ